MHSRRCFASGDINIKLVSPDIDRQPAGTTEAQDLSHRLARPCWTGKIESNLDIEIASQLLESAVTLKISGLPRYSAAFSKSAGAVSDP